MPEQNSTRYSGTRRLFRAPWVVVSGAVAGRPDGTVLADGAVLVERDRILTVGRYRDLKREDLDASVIDHDGAILTPALVNAHCHLELSHLGGQPPAVGSAAARSDFTAWIESIIARRLGIDGQVVTAAGRQALASLYRTGTCLVADIGNDYDSRLIGLQQSVQVLFFLEILGFSCQSGEEAEARLAGNIPAAASCAAHAPYSVSPVLFQRLKERAKSQRRILPVHLAETVDEREFLLYGTGIFRKFLEKRGLWDGSFSPPGTGSVEYLDKLGILDSETLCVHTVHVSEAEIETLARRQAKVCLCPASNSFLDVGVAPVPMMLAKGILPALGTDSLASNTGLSIWREMQVIRQDHPSIKPSAVFAMATQGGASALGMGNVLGQLVPGRQASVLAVRFSGVENMRVTEGDIFDLLTSAGETAQVSWA